MAFSCIRYERDGPIATVTLDRPDKLNAMSFAMIDELIAAADMADADDAVRAVIYTGAGDRAFCAGTDLTPDGGGTFTSDEEIDDLSDERARDVGGRLTLRLFQSKKPLIAACNGVAVGVGATMQLPMDYRLAAEGARFGFVFARRGIAPDAASSWFLPKIVGTAQAIDWCMSGRIFDAGEALSGGLVRSLHPSGDLMDAARAVALEIAENTSAVSVAMTRAMLWRLSGEPHPMAAHRVDSRAIYRLARSADAQEGVTSFLEKRLPDFPDRVSADMPDVFPWWDEPRYE